MSKRIDEQWLASDIPQISPDAKFREELHRALQASYERQQTQRQQPRERHPLLRTSAIFFTLLSLLALTVGIVYSVQRRTY
jgi:hypothetical protein